MEVLGSILMVIGVIVASVGGIWILIEAFKESMLWGIGCLFINVLGLVFVFLHWDVAKKPFLINLAGAAIMILGAILGGIGS